VCYIPPLLWYFSLLRSTMQLDRRCSPSCNTFPSFCLAFTRESQTFWQSATRTISAKLVMDSRHFGFYLLAFPLTSTNKWNCSTRDGRNMHQRKMGDGELKISLVIQIYVYAFCVQIKFSILPTLLVMILNKK